MLNPLDKMTAIISGIFIGIIGIISSVSLAALIFSGDLSAYLVHGINIALITALISGLIVSLFGNCKATISIPQDRVAPLLAIMAATVAGSISTEFNSQQAFFSVVVLIVATTFFTGIFLLTLGWAKVGGLMRFMPYSVLGGFLAGTGWLLALGGLRVMTSLELNSAQDILLLINPDALLLWLPGLLIAVLIIILSRLMTSLKAIPLVLLIATAIFYLIMQQQGYSINSMNQQNWLIGPLESSSYDSIKFIFWNVAGQANWSFVGEQWLNIWSVLVISAMSIIFSASALELLSGKDININKELRIAGIANLVSGFGGGMTGFHSLSLSSLALNLKNNTRTAGIITALIAGIALFYGTEILGFIPRFIIGGLLMYLGLSFLKQWLIDSRHKLTPGEFLIISVIMLVIASIGFVEGIFTGLLAALFLFVLNYSRVPVVRYNLTGVDTRSSVERNLNDERYLNKHGNMIKIMKLRGYLFFGTMVQLLNSIKNIANENNGHNTRFVLLDFLQVSGIDSSASYHFNRLQRVAQGSGFKLLLTDLSPTLKRLLHSGDLIKEGETTLEFTDMDHGLEWCENQILRHAGGSSTRKITTIIERLSETLDKDTINNFLSYLEEIDFDKGHVLIKQDTPSNSMYFLEEGEVSVYLVSSSGDKNRVRRTGAGTVIGELGFYLGTPRSASVISDTPGKAYRLTAQSLEKMKKHHPDFAVILHQFMANLLAERLLRTTNTLKTVLE